MKCVILLAAGALAAAAVIQSPSPPTEALGAEIASARAALEQNAPESDRTAPLARLDRAKAALDAGRLYLAAYLTESGWEGAKNWAFVKASSDITTEDAFLKKWTAMGVPKPAASRATKLPAIVEAMAAVAEARGATTYHASRPYAADAGLFGGLYYLSDAHAVMQFASMIRGIAWPGAGTPPAFRSIADEIAALDVEMTTAYETMERAQHSTYIVASAALKQARTLNERKQFGGALFEYLLARYIFAPLRGPAAGEATSARVAEARGALNGADHSVAELFLQLADEALAGGSDQQKRNAAAILEDVLPAYRAALAAPSTTTAAAAKAQVTITLVRWPFT